MHTYFWTISHILVLCYTHSDSQPIMNLCVQGIEYIKVSPSVENDLGSCGGCCCTGTAE